MTGSARAKRVLLELMVAPMWFWGALSLTLALMLGLAKKPRRDRTDKGLAMAATWRPWVARRYKYSLTVAKAVFYHPAHGGPTQEHEHTHIDQAEVMTLAGFVLALGLVWWSWIAALIVWATSPGLMGANYLQSWLDGDKKGVYRGAENEEAAYAINR